MSELLAVGRITDLDALGPAETLESYVGRGGYEGLRRALSMEPEQITAQVDQAGVVGRGGAGFPAAAKWRMAAANPGPRYLVVNGAEGEPGSYKDRHLMARAPHQVLEGIAIASRAIGATTAVVYVNRLFAKAGAALEAAAGELGSSDLAKALPKLSVRVEHHVYIAGEETALLAALIGRPPWPWPKPPYPAERGLYGSPTVVNNVETLAHVSAVLRLGPAWYQNQRPILFSVTGDVSTPVVVESSLGVSLESL